MFDNQEKLMDRVSNAIGLGVDVISIHEFLAREGLSEYDIFLTYKGGEMLYNFRARFQPKPFHE